MDKLRKYQKRKALAEANYITKLSVAKRMMGEARTEYEEELANALFEYQEKKAKDLTVQWQELRI